MCSVTSFCCLDLTIVATRAINPVLSITASRNQLMDSSELKILCTVRMSNVAGAALRRFSISFCLAVSAYSTNMFTESSRCTGTTSTTSRTSSCWLISGTTGAVLMLDGHFLGTTPSGNTSKDASRSISSPVGKQVRSWASTPTWSFRLLTDWFGQGRRDRRSGSLSLGRVVTCQSRVLRFDIVRVGTIDVDVNRDDEWKKVRRLLIRKLLVRDTTCKTQTVKEIAVFNFLGRQKLCS